TPPQLKRPAFWISTAPLPPASAAPQAIATASSSRAASTARIVREARTVAISLPIQVSGTEAASVTPAASRPATIRRAPLSSTVLAELQPPDLATVHLVGPIGEAQGARVGPHGRQRELLAHAAAAVELHGALDHLQRHVGHGHLDLGDRLLGGLVADRVHHVGGVQDEQPRLVDLDARLRDALERDVVLGQPLAERHAVLRALAHELERALGDADLAHAVVDAARTQAPLGDLEAAALAQQDVRGRYADVLEDHFAVAVGRVVVTEYGQHAEHLDARRVAGHQDYRLLLVAIRVLRVGLAHEDENLAARVADARAPP